MANCILNCLLLIFGLGRSEQNDDHCAQRFSTENSSQEFVRFELGDQLCLRGGSFADSRSSRDDFFACVDFENMVAEEKMNESKMRVQLNDILRSGFYGSSYEVNAKIVLLLREHIDTYEQQADFWNAFCRLSKTSVDPRLVVPEQKNQAVHRLLTSDFLERSPQIFPNRLPRLPSSK